MARRRNDCTEEMNHLRPSEHLSSVNSLAESDITATAARAAAGDRVAFARVVAMHHADMVRVAYVVCGDAEMAQDATQSAWVIAWRKLGSVRDPNHIRGWLTSVAANEARQQMRHRRRRAAVEAAARPTSEAGSGDPAYAITRLDLINALEQLKQEDRALLALHYVAGLDSREIGSLRGMSPSGVRGRISRLLGQLRRKLDDA